MSARNELFESLTPHDRHPAPGETESVNALLDAYRDEILRSAASRIRKHPDTKWWGQGKNRDDFADDIANWYGAANLIDPAKP